MQQTELKKNAVPDTDIGNRAVGSVGTENGAKRIEDGTGVSVETESPAKSATEPKKASGNPAEKLKFLIINGPNLNLLGIREPAIYGKDTYKTLCRTCLDACRDTGVECELFQSNHEGAIVDKIQEAYGRADGIVINPAAYTHTSVAILDALKAVGIPVAEVHISDVNEREEFRRHSYIAPIAAVRVIGEGIPGYARAIRELKVRIEKRS